MNNFYYLVDVDKEARDIKYARRMMVCDALARSLLFCDKTKPQIINTCKCFWNFSETKRYKYESEKAFEKKIVLWYLKNKIIVQDEIWNGSFLQGMATYGKLKKSKHKGVEFSWWSNRFLFRALDQSPFSAILSNRFLLDQPQNNTNKEFKCHSYSFYLKSDKYSQSYVAGIFVGGSPVVVGGIGYVQYPAKLKDVFEYMKIPIEGWNKYKRMFYVSPFWPALFEGLMPDRSRIYRNIVKPHMAQEYAAALWSIYTTKDNLSDKIPFLPSRRWIFYNFKNEEYGAIKFLQKKYVEWKLVELHNVFKDRILYLGGIT